MAPWRLARSHYPRMHVASVLWQVAREGSRTGAGNRTPTAKAAVRRAAS